MKKKCELCQQPARAYCESDQAILCWSCDSKVHGANFLVARHSRTLLCHACHAPTAWNASGEKLPHAFSVCHRCVSNENIHAGNDDSDDDENHDSHYEDDDDDVSDADCDEEGENQVVTFASTPPPPSVSSSSSEEDSRYRRRSVDNASDLRSQDDLRRLAARLRCETDCTADTDGGEAASVDCTRPLKHRRLNLNRPITRISPDIEYPAELAENSVKPSILSLVSI